jgi:hypothetical protein
MQKIWDFIKLVFGIVVMSAVVLVFGAVALWFMCGTTHGACDDGHEMKGICSVIGLCDSATKSKDET